MVAALKVCSIYIKSSLGSPQDPQEFKNAYVVICFVPEGKKGIHENREALMISSKPRLMVEQKIQNGKPLILPPLFLKF